MEKLIPENEKERINRMSMISEQVKELRILAEHHRDLTADYFTAISLSEAAYTIESLSAKLAVANMGSEKEIENLCIVAMEECAEIQQALSKSMRFGFDNCNPQTPEKTNASDIMTEYYQLQSVMEMLIGCGLVKEFEQGEIEKIKNDKRKNVSEFFSVKLAAENMERSERHYGENSEDVAIGVLEPHIDAYDVPLMCEGKDGWR